MTEIGISREVGCVASTVPRPSKYKPPRPLRTSLLYSLPERLADVRRLNVLQQVPTYYAAQPGSAATPNAIGCSQSRIAAYAPSPTTTAPTSPITLTAASDPGPLSPRFFTAIRSTTP